MKPRLLSDALTDDLRAARYRGNPQRLAGHCYVASEAIYHHFMRIGITNVKPMFVRHEGEPHWYLMVGSKPLDYTASQFSTPVPYEQGRGKGFLTKEPSKRARIVMERMGWA